MLRRYKLLGEWKSSTGGLTTFAEKGGHKYFLKKYDAPIRPTHDQVESGVLTEKKYQRGLERFNRFYALRSDINNALRSMACAGGNIICPLEWGIDDNKFVEATEYVPELLERGEVERLSDKDKVMVLMTAIGALVTVHKQDIIHGDLKYTNIAVAKNSMGFYVGKLIDFDCSYFCSKKPPDLGGDQIYMSPELGFCWLNEMSPDCIAQVDFKSDIFSLGVLFHEYMTRQRPEMGRIPEEMAGKDPELIYYWEYVLYGGEPQVSRKIKNKRLANLIVSMLQLDPTKRPTAQETLAELKLVRDELSGKISTTPPPPAPPKPAPAARTFEDPWPEHGIVYDKAALERMKFVGGKRAEIAGKKCYEFYREGGTKHPYNLDRLLSTGLAKRAGATPPPPPPATPASGFAEPWPEHNIEFVQAEINRLKYVSSTRIEVMGKKAYEFARASGTKHRYTKEKALAEGLAKNK